MTIDRRLQDLGSWHQQIYPNSEQELLAISADASFRRYFGLATQDSPYLLVDAPKTTEKNHEFVAISQLLRRHDIAVPEVYHVDYQQGFLAVENLGQQTFASLLGQVPMAELYKNAIELLAKIQQLPTTELTILEPFDRDFIQRELDIFSEWFVERHLGLKAKEWQEQAAWSACCESLIQQLSQQPRVAMHRDFHSRNLIFHKQQLYTIDFQDMVHGPETYDYVSLLKDCYVELSPTELEGLKRYAFELSNPEYSFAEWSQNIDFCGIQRHLKVLGIFTRLHYRDGKSTYLKDLPLTARYLLSSLSQYPEFKPFIQWLKPHLEAL